ncbi:DnaJ-domain-containing protein [Xylaria scruposa]|nr:DnaJ-domain-containing protein [Xylaria scruposa]
MPPRSAVSPLLAAPAPIQRQCLCLFLYPPSTLSTSRRPELLSRNAIPTRQRNALRGVNLRRSFHGTAARQDDAIDNARNHYETLKIAPTASPADIKKSFYNLSKTHHPDLHEAAGRRAAARRFMRISEAYSILSSPTKRSKYDREHMGIISSSTVQHPHKGSYASTGPAGGRPASGLSRRRGTFQGPPPSFYRSGGWGAQGEKRRAAHEESTGGMGGMGPGQDPFGHREDVPHFDKEGHQRTGRHSDKRREARRAATVNDDGQRVAIEPERGVAGMFFAIGGVLLLSFVVPYVVSQIWFGAARKPKEKDGAAKGRG